MMPEELLNVLKGNLALVEYLKELCNTLCDIRNMPTITETEQKGRLEAVKVIEKYLIKPLTLPGKNDNILNKQYK